MDVLEAAMWGMAGGVAAGLISLSAAIVAAGFEWPWADARDGVWPRLVVAAIGLVVGAVVAAGAASQMSGPWPALIMGVSAPSVIRGVLGRIEVEERKPERRIGEQGDRDAR